mgnify:CR=1 FL=1
MTNISITNSKNNVGAYINDIDLKKLNQSKAEKIKKALNQFGVIFIKGQNLNPESYQNFAKSIGQPVVYPRLKGLDEKFPFINVIERKPDDKNLSFGGSNISTQLLGLVQNGSLDGKDLDANTINSLIQQPVFKFKKPDDKNPTEFLFDLQTQYV